MRTQSLKVLPLKPGVGQYTARHAALTFTLPVHSPAFFPKPLPSFSCVSCGWLGFLCRPAEWNRSPCWMQVPVLSARGIETGLKKRGGGLVVSWLVKSTTLRQNEVCVQPWCNPLWLNGLKAPTNQLTTSLLVRSWSSPLLPPTRSMWWQIEGCIRAFHQWRWVCGGHGVFPAWSFLGTGWTGLVKVSIPDGHLLLSWRTFQADCSRGPHSWSSHIVSEWLELVLPLCWSFWRPATGVHARLSNAFLKSMKL